MGNSRDDGQKHWKSRLSSCIALCREHGHSLSVRMTCNLGACFEENNWREHVPVRTRADESHCNPLVQLYLVRDNAWCKQTRGEKKLLTLGMWRLLMMSTLRIKALIFLLLCSHNIFCISNYAGVNPNKGFEDYVRVCQPPHGQFTRARGHNAWLYVTHRLPLGSTHPLPILQLDTGLWLTGVRRAKNFAQLPKISKCNNTSADLDANVSYPKLKMYFYPNLNTTYVKAR